MLVSASKHSWSWENTNATVWTDVQYAELEHTEDRLAASRPDDLSVKLHTQFLDYPSIIYN